jgi:hypothetical protein
METAHQSNNPSIRLNPSVFIRVYPWLNCSSSVYLKSAGDCAATQRAAKQISSVPLLKLSLCLMWPRKLKCVIEPVFTPGVIPPTGQNFS